jgi:uncharacterized protein YjiK
MTLLIHQLVTLLLLLTSGNNFKKIPFNINKPEIKIELSKELKEISGLTWYKNQLAAVQDEAGIIYFLEPNTGAITNKIKFSLPGDFEGIEAIGDDFYCLVSSGTLFNFHINSPDKVTRIETPLTWKNDVEGLTFDIKTQRLLISSKEQAGLDSEELKGKAIYGLDIEKNILLDEPIAIIRKKDVKKFVDTEKFKPSGLAIDPLTQNLYVLASSGKLLIVLDPTYTVISAIKLSSKIFAQPEGICFSPNGDLYISNEGRKDHANFYCFTRIH